jgi:predicted DNA-binding mobile mystery protein A
MDTRKLLQKQLDDKLVCFQKAYDVVPPSTGWIHAFRKALNMSLRQLAQRISITPQSVREIEERERNGTVSLKVLRQVATALDMKFVYGFVPREQSLDAMIEKRARELAEKLVERTSIHMSLEDQKVSDEGLKRIIEDKTREFVEEVPKMLWD